MYDRLQGFVLDELSFEGRQIVDELMQTAANQQIFCKLVIQQVQAALSIILFQQQTMILFTYSNPYIQYYFIDLFVIYRQMECNNQEIMQGETMFDYLKRKKRLMLEQSLNRSQSLFSDTKRESNAQKSLNNSKMDAYETRRPKLNENINHSNLKQVNHKQQNRNNRSSEVIPKRVSFVEEQKRVNTRSFLQLISPLKNKSPLPIEVQKSLRPTIMINKKSSYKQNYVKKMLIQKIWYLRDIMEKFIKTGKTIKQKSHLLFVQLKPFLRHMQHSEQSDIQRKTYEIKAKLKNFEHLFQQFNTQNSQNAIESFYKYFSQHLNQLEGCTKSEIEVNRKELLRDVQEQKNMKIDQLENKNYLLQKQLDLISKKYNKMEKHYEQMLNQQQSYSNAANNHISTKLKNLQLINQQLNQNLNSKVSQIASLKDRISQFEYEKKLMVQQKQKYQQEAFMTITKVKGQQQQFLLNEIMVLKKQFNADITQMAKLNKMKQDEYLNRIEEANKQNKLMRAKVDQLLEINKKTQQQANINLATATRFKRQNQCISIDIHRINQQLYQHWLALKDIKSLSYRLQIFYKFKKIYQELSFNDQLFF